MMGVADIPIPAAAAISIAAGFFLAFAVAGLVVLAAWLVERRKKSSS